MAIMTEHPNDAIPIQGTIIGRQDHNGPNGPGFGNEGDPMYTIDSVSLHGVGQSVAFNIYGGNKRPDRPEGGFYVEETNQTKTLDSTSGLNPSANQGGTAITAGMIVRRLTPLECERLMGWPDNHTAVSVNGPVADTHRYKMCGNGVASPVAEWIGKALLAITKEDADE